ncbi:hypothetical protein [Indiicoccus explosivorum]|uniref:hypothetical protein n=1 Tax=Indiicoccus explosivorum TaxID=1917864 RepID=UPI000B4310DC|nr:hypothetical protein [Indiicoccus explosivorum]
MGYILPYQHYTYEQYASRTAMAQYDFAHVGGVERILPDQQEDKNRRQEESGQGEGTAIEERDGQQSQKELRTFQGYIPPNPAELPESVRQSAVQLRATENPYS